MKTFFLLITMWSSCVFAKNIQIVTSEIYPFGYFDSNGKNKGMIFEISNKIAKVAGFNFENKIIPYPRTILDLKNGSADFVIRYVNKDLKNVAIQVGETVGFSSVILGRNNVEFKSLNDLHGKTVAIIRGGLFDDQFDADNKIIKYDVKDYEQMLNMLILKRVDAVIGSDVGLYYTAEKLHIPKSQLSRPLLLQKKYFILNYSKKNADLKTIEILKKSINKLQCNGEFERIEKKYKSEIKI